MISEEELKKEIENLCIEYMGSLPTCSESFGQDDNTIIGSVEVFHELYKKYVGFNDYD